MHLFTEFSWIASSRAFSFVTSILLVKILADNMSFEQYANLMLGLTLFNLMTQIVMAPVGQGVGRVYVVAKKNNNLASFRNASILIYKKIGMIYVAIISAVVILPDGILDRDIKTYLIALFIYAYIFGINDILNSLLNLGKMRIKFSLSILIEQIVKLLITYLCVSFLNITPIDVIIGYIFAVISTLFYHKQVSVNDLIKIEIQNKRNTELHWKRRIGQVAIPASLWGIAVWAQQASDKWALQLFSTKQEVAQFAVLYQISYVPLIMGFGMLMTLTSPLIFGENNHKSVIKKLIALLAIIGSGAFFIAAFLGENIVNAIVGSKYIAIAEYMHFMILAACLYQAGDIFTQGLLRRFKTGEILKIKLLSSIISVGLNAYLAYSYGISGIVASALLFSLTYFSLSYYFYEKNFA